MIKNIYKTKNFVKKRLLKLISKKEDLQPTFNSFKEALDASGSYEEEELVKVIVAKSKAYKETLNKDEYLDLSSLSDARVLRTLITIAAGINANSLSVLDFGGSAGVHYLTADKFLNDSINLNWSIVETDLMVREAKLNNLENKNLKFYSSIEKANKKSRKFDVIYANYSLCYTPEPLDYLSKLLKLNYKTFFLTNTAVNTENKEIIGLQTSSLSTNGIGREIPKHLNISDKIIKYPFTVPSKKALEDEILKYGNIASVFKEVSGSYKTTDGTFDNYGYIITKK